MPAKRYRVGDASECIDFTLSGSKLSVCGLSRDALRVRSLFIVGDSSKGLAFTLGGSKFRVRGSMCERSG